MSSDRLPRRLAVIHYADVAGYSRLTDADEDATHRRLSEYLDLVSDNIAGRLGRVMLFTCDAILATFEAATDAETSTLSVQTALAE